MTSNQRDRVAIALWAADVEGMAEPDRLPDLWAKVCSHFPDDAAAYRKLADAAIAAIAASEAS